MGQARPAAPPETPSRYLTLDELSRVSNISKSTLHRRIKEGTGPRVCRPSPKLLRISEADFHAWMHAH
jgi:excisionase family DNA binding protein